jgi:neutral ceramidase
MKFHLSLWNMHCFAKVIVMRMQAAFVRRISVLFVALFFTSHLYSQEGTPGGTMEVGVARVDITPTSPIRLAGYANREKSESTELIHRLEAKAIAFGSTAQNPAIFITVDLVGIPGWITANLREQLSKKMGIRPEQLVICASHTHGGPELGTLLNILQYRGNAFTDSLLELTHLIHITEYVNLLSQKLEEVALAALRDRKPALVAWGQGQAGFARNRRTRGGPVDPSLPILRITDADGKLKAILVSYACHGTTLEGSVNKIHGDWIAEAQRIIEVNHPGVIAMVAVGCAGDANPQPRGAIEHMTMHGEEISKNVNKLLSAQLQPLTTPPTGHMKSVRLHYAAKPDVQELIRNTNDRSIKGYYARLALEEIARGEDIPDYLSYPVQVWTFGNELAMVNLPGEVVVDYSIRLKNELGAEKLWVNAYANDVPCYIASRRVIREGGYEAETSMYYYNKPSAFKEDVEDTIISAVHDLLPVSFKLKRDTVNRLELVEASSDGSLILWASKANAIGPNIKYMPEWKAFGWFNTEDSSEWDINIPQKGAYQVYLEWSVSDRDAGRLFVFEAGDKKLKGKIGPTGSWFTYRTERIGSLKLLAGKQKIVFRSDPGSKKGPMLDLRKIVLKPGN